jgi:hypothetical protein
MVFTPAKPSWLHIGEIFSLANGLFQRLTPNFFLPTGNIRDFFLSICFEKTFISQQVKAGETLSVIALGC